MTLTEFIQTISGFAGFRHHEKISIFLWWLHTHRGIDRANTGDVARCYDELSLGTSNTTSELNRLVDRGLVLKNKDGYRLEMGLHEALSTKYGRRDSTIYVDNLLNDLPTKLGNLKERAYLEETLICFRHKAFRATIVMVWNLAYDHICEWILADTKRLDAFNAQMAKTYAKKNYPPIVNRDSFEEPKEFEVLQVLASASLINGGMHMILKEKLDRRNKAAHPSGVAIFQPIAEGAIHDLIENIVMKLI